MEKIIEIRSNSLEFLQMVFEMLIIMNKLNQSEKIVMMSEAVREANGYFTENRRVFVYKIKNKMVGYSVLKIEDRVCWLDWLYVDPDHQGKGEASKLFDHAEEISLKLGNDQLYIWVHPDNHRMLKFLKKKGYDVLNLIEVKKKKPSTSRSISILGNELRY
ncbi:MAG: GNAT family N-acetyltransferase [Anaerolineaceae bacterium]|nr:GNAT family N-acetyltransferase [Anaerolineaceae bacterium]